jgi:hypothetical protein
MTPWGKDQAAPVGMDGAIVMATPSLGPISAAKER